MDVLVIGGGSGGIAAALAAARMGLQVTLIEAAATLGGTATQSLVCSWEPGMGGTGMPLEAYRRLRRRQAVGIHRLKRHCCAPEPRLAHFPGGEHRLDPQGTYAQTLRRWRAAIDESGEDPGKYPYEFISTHLRGVSFVPEVWQEEAALWLCETGVQVRTGIAVVAAERQGETVISVQLADGTQLQARTYIDATADVVVARAAGCRTRLGCDARADFAEPGAPLTASEQLNGVSLVYRITPDALAPDPGPIACWWAKQFPVSHMVELPDGDRVVNPLPIMEGTLVHMLGLPAARAEAERRTLAHWQDLQNRWPEFRGYRLRAQALALGIREGHRIEAERMLTEHDLRDGLAAQTDPDLIAVADHAIDVHGYAGGARELTGPYGIPFRCLIPRGCRNMVIACRGAGFSSIAASSCRLSRTMMQLGQAAGTAAALAQRQGTAVAAVDAAQLRAALISQGVQLSAEPDAFVQIRVAMAESA